MSWCSSDVEQFSRRLQGARSERDGRSDEARAVPKRIALHRLIHTGRLRTSAPSACAKPLAATAPGRGFQPGKTPPTATQCNRRVASSEGREPTTCGGLEEISERRRTIRPPLDHAGAVSPINLVQFTTGNEPGSGSLKGSGSTHGVVPTLCFCVYFSSAMSPLSTSSSSRTLDGSLVTAASVRGTPVGAVIRPYNPRVVSFAPYARRQTSARTKSSLPLGPAAWARCIARATRS